MRGKAPLVLIAGIVLVAALVIGTAAQRSVSAPRQSTKADPDAGVRFTYPSDRPSSLALPGGRTERVRSVLNVRGRMKYGDSLWNDTGVAPGPVWIRVDLKHQVLSVFRGGHEIGTAVILYGIRDKESPEGTFPVLQKAADYHSITYDAPMPYMLRLTADGVAIHGANVRRGAATHGCIGVPTAFARRLFDEVKLGDRVVIMNSADQI